MGLAVSAGTLITAPLGRKFLLTADHCFVGKCILWAGACVFIVPLPGYNSVHTIEQLCDGCCVQTRRPSTTLSTGAGLELVYHCVPLALAQDPIPPKGCVLLYTKRRCWLCRVLILNYEQPCNSNVIPPITQVIQVGCLALSKHSGTSLEECSAFCAPQGNSSGKQAKGAPIAGLPNCRVSSTFETYSSEDPGPQQD